MADRKRERYFIGEHEENKFKKAERRLEDLRERFDEAKKSIPGDMMFDILANSDAESSALLGATLGAVKAYINVIGSQTEMLIELEKDLDYLRKDVTDMRLEMAEIRRES